MSAVLEEPETGLQEHQTFDCLLKVADASEDAVDLMERILWDRLRAMRNRLYRLLSGRSGNVLLLACYDIYNAMPPAQQARILLSSELCELYSMSFVDKATHDAPVPAEGIPADVVMVQSRVLDLVLREHAIHMLQAGTLTSYLKLQKADEVYSPLGDLVARRDRHGQWSIDRVPMLDDVIAVDFDSPVARNYEPRSGVLSQPRLDFTDQEKAAVMEKLSRALSAIDEVEPAYGFLIRNFVRRIIVRKSRESANDDPGRVFGSEHVPRQPGSMRLLNTHLPELSPDALMESLLHESTHNFLAAWELANGPFVPHSQKDRAVSPWSGNGIPNSSYIHASFIYYVCHRMYTKHLLAVGNDPARVPYLHKRLAKFIAGYMINRHTADQLVLEKPIAAELRAVIGTMQSRVQATYGYTF